MSQTDYRGLQIPRHKEVRTFPVPADLKSAVKKGSTIENGGFVIPQ